MNEYFQLYHPENIIYLYYNFILQFKYNFELIMII